MWAALALAFAATAARGGTVRSVTVEYAPAAESGGVLSGLRVGVAPVIGATDLSRHTERVDRARRRLQDDEAERLVGIGFNAYNKPLLRFVAEEPPASTLGAALERELAALGATVVAASTVPPGDLEPRSLAACVGPAEVDLVIAVRIEDLFFETRPGLVNIDLESSLAVEVAVLDVRAGQLAWRGPVRVDETDRAAIAMGTKAVETSFGASFGRLVEEMVRRNPELLRALPRA